MTGQRWIDQKVSYVIYRVISTLFPGKPLNDFKHEELHIILWQLHGELFGSGWVKGHNWKQGESICRRLQ